MVSGMISNTLEDIAKIREDYGESRRTDLPLDAEEIAILSLAENECIFDLLDIAQKGTDGTNTIGDNLLLALCRNTFEVQKFKNTRSTLDCCEVIDSLVHPKLVTYWKPHPDQGCRVAALLFKEMRVLDKSQDPKFSPAPLDPSSPASENTYGVFICGENSVDLVNLEI
jgi:hypothetical protein